MLKLLIGVVVVVLFVAWLRDEEVDYTKPWFTGDAAQRVCRMPYYDNYECYTLRVVSNGETLENIYFPKGGWISPSSVECVKAGEGLPITRFCRYSDSEGRDWEVLPLLDDNYESK